MKKTIALALALLLLAPAAARAAQSYLDTLTDQIAADVADIFTHKINLEQKENIPVALYTFKDLTNKFQSDTPTLRKLLFGKLSLDKRFKPVPLENFDSDFNTLYPSRTIDELNQEQIIKLSRKTGADYVISAKIVLQDSRPVLQLFIYNAAKGILLFTPQFPIKFPAADTPPAPVPAPTPPAPPEQSGKPDMTPGKPVYFTGALPASTTLDLLPAHLDGDKKPEVVFITNSSMEIVRLNGTKAESISKNPYKKTFPARGLTGTLNRKTYKDKTFIFVSMNTLSGAIMYSWDNNKPVKFRNFDSFISHVDPQTGAALFSSYVDGQTAFNGATAYLTDNTGDAKAKINFKIPSNYLSACVMEWNPMDSNQDIVAVVDEKGALKIYRGAGKVVAQAAQPTGAAIDCWKAPSTGNFYILASTTSHEKDAVQLFVLKKKASAYTLEKSWASGAFDGALSRLKFFDLDGDGRPEVLGLREKPAGDAPKMFYMAVPFAKEDTK